jgi:hypothetical protein
VIHVVSTTRDGSFDRTRRSSRHKRAPLMDGREYCNLRAMCALRKIGALSTVVELCVPEIDKLGK